MVPVNLDKVKRESVILNKVKQGDLDEVQTNNDDNLTLKQLISVRKGIKSLREETCHKKEINKSIYTIEVEPKNIETSKIHHSYRGGVNNIFRKQFSSKIYEIKDLLEGRVNSNSTVDKHVDEDIEDILVEKIDNIKNGLSVMKMPDLATRKDGLSVKKNAGGVTIVGKKS